MTIEQQTNPPQVEQNMRFRRQIADETFCNAFGKLVKLSQAHDGIRLRLTDTAQIKSKLYLIDRYEFEPEINPCLPPGLLCDPGLPSYLGQRLPYLRKERPATFNSISVGTSPTTRVQYINLLYDLDSGNQNGLERADIWHALGNYAKVPESDLVWEPHNPSSPLCSFGPDISPKVVEHVAAFIKKKLPLEVTLGRMIDDY